MPISSELPQPPRQGPAIFPGRINQLSEYQIDEQNNHGGTTRELASTAIAGSMINMPESEQPTPPVPTELPVNPSGELIDPTRKPATGQISTGDPGFPK